MYFEIRFVCQLPLPVCQGGISNLSFKVNMDKNSQEKTKFNLNTTGQTVVFKLNHLMMKMMWHDRKLRKPSGQKAKEKPAWSETSCWALTCLWYQRWSVIGQFVALVLVWRQCGSELRARGSAQAGGEADAARLRMRMEVEASEKSVADSLRGPERNAEKSIWKIQYGPKLRTFVPRVCFCFPNR